MGMVELGLESLEKAARRVGRDPVEAASDSSCCWWSWDWEEDCCWVEDEAPISPSSSFSSASSSFACCVDDVYIIIKCNIEEFIY